MWAMIPMLRTRSSATRVAVVLIRASSSDIALCLAREKQARLGRRERPYRMVWARLRTAHGAALQPRGTGWMLLEGALASTSPPVVREGLVRLRHPVHVVLALEGAALLVDRVLELRGELRLHPLLAPLTRIRDEVAQRERPAARRRH